MLEHTIPAAAARVQKSKLYHTLINCNRHHPHHQNQNHHCLDQQNQ